MSVNWVKIYSTTQLHKAEIVRAVLEVHEIQTTEMNKMDSMHTHLFLGEIEVFVNQDNAICATHLITKHDL
tara:strand:+ start:51673 stop:51885 length:213 start_codon:yes stop_codon:yes gene_type:complete